jgi:hypothetical protein
VRLAGLGHFYHWPIADLVGLTVSEICFWESAARSFLDEVRSNQEQS